MPDMGPYAKSNHFQSQLMTLIVTSLVRLWRVYPVHRKRHLKLTWSRGLKKNIHEASFSKNSTGALLVEGGTV